MHSRIFCVGGVSHEDTLYELMAPRGVDYVSELFDPDPADSVEWLADSDPKVYGKVKNEPFTLTVKKEAVIGFLKKRAKRLKKLVDDAFEKDAPENLYLDFMKSFRMTELVSGDSGGFMFYDGDTGCVMTELEFLVDCCRKGIEKILIAEVYDYHC